MQIEFDPAKDASNVEKHGVSLARSNELEWDYLIAVEDTREEYGEQRMIGYAPIGERLFCVVYVDREDVRRIISLRKANSREVRNYEQA